MHLAEEGPRSAIAWATTGSGPEKGPGAGPEAIADSPTLGAGLHDQA